MPHHRSSPGIPQLRTAYRLLRRVSTLTALGYFVLFLVLSGYAPGFLGRHISGGLTAGLLLGLCQLPVTLVAIGVYEWTAQRTVDPLAAAIRHQATQRPPHSRRYTDGAGR
ncbi:DUF485 domain-containing protein [Streptomyces sp. NPDC058301]|uniref:DUF485 domain-containing protein n=1 Tax=Streptomyces sp. NPDC058301 TaxID=3346436 RepID=UPI0036F0BBEB